MRMIGRHQASIDARDSGIVFKEGDNPLGDRASRISVPENAVTDTGNDIDLDLAPEPLRDEPRTRWRKEAIGCPMQYEPPAGEMWANQSVNCSKSRAYHILPLRDCRSQLGVEHLSAKLGVIRNRVQAPTEKGDLAVEHETKSVSETVRAEDLPDSRNATWSYEYAGIVVAQEVLGEKEDRTEAFGNDVQTIGLSYSQLVEEVLKMLVVPKRGRSRIGRCGPHGTHLKP